MYDNLIYVYYWAGFFIINGAGLALTAFCIFYVSEKILTYIFRTYKIWDNCMEYFRNREAFMIWKTGGKQ
jgi:hypothetical protein